MLQQRFEQATPILPSFPNWNKSFVSGHNSPLFEVDHRVALEPLELISKVRFKNTAEGPPGHIHGGASAALIDEVMGILVWNQNFPCLTKQLELKFLRPLPLNSEAMILTVITAVHEKTISVKTTIFGNKKTPCVEGTGVFHRMSKEMLDQFITPSPSE